MIMKKINKYFRGVGEEARRIRWPSRKDLFQSVAKVLAIGIVSALAIVLSDYLIMQIIHAVEEAYPSATSGDASSTGEAVAMLAENLKHLLGR